MLNNLAALYSSGVVAAATSYESIATVTVGAGGSSSITFSSIPSTYKHLQIRGIARTADTSYNQLKVRFNSDSAANYASHILDGDGSTAAALAYTGSTNGVQMWVGLQAGAAQSANVFGANILDILDYSNTSKNKTLRSLSGADGNGSGYVWFSSGLWMSTSAVSTITLTSEAGTNFQQYSQFALYGVKG